MIRAFRESDLSAIMQIWLDTNIMAHRFIPAEYWKDNYETVSQLLPQAEVYVYEDDATGQIFGFIGLTGNYIAGIFVKEEVQSRGIGKRLLCYVKSVKSNLSLSVYQKNIRAVRFYHREQFALQSERMDDSTGEKEYIMVWTSDFPLIS